MPRRVAMTDFVQLWVYLSAARLFGLTATLVVYVSAVGSASRSSISVPLSLGVCVGKEVGMGEVARRALTHHYSSALALQKACRTPGSVSNCSMTRSSSGASTAVA